MKKSLLLLLFACLAFGGQMFASIVTDEPIIRMNGDRPEYIKFVGTDTENNYKYTLETYDSEAHFQLVIEPVNTNSPAAFPSNVASDENYWEPLFRQYTQQLAGEAMEASRNIKKIYITDVALQPYQFSGYCDALKEVYITAKGDYTIPAGCFARGRVDGYSIRTMECKVEGNLTIGDYAVDYEKSGGLTIYTANEGIAKTWFEYKNTHNCAYTIYFNGAIYNGGGGGGGIVTNDPTITGVTISYSINNNGSRANLPNQGGELMNETGVTELKILGFNATVTGNVTELFMDYAVFPENQSGAQHNWKQAYASLQEDGTWAFSGSTIDLLQGLQSNTAYKVEYCFNTNPTDKGGRAHYPTSGELISMKFTTGELPETPSVITLDEPIIRMNGDRPEYIKFVGTDTQDNFKYTLETYDNEAHFQLVIEPVISKQGGAFPEGITSDKNYWEPLFRQYTQQLAGEAMEASENIKILNITDVTLQPYQFAGYCGALNSISITSDGDYFIPAGCFSKGNSKNYSLKSLECKVNGNLYIDENAVDYEAGGLNIYTYNENIAKTWIIYKIDHNCAYTVYFNGSVYNGGGGIVDEDPYIAGVSLSYTLNNADEVNNLLNQGGEIMNEKGVTVFKLTGFNAMTSGYVTEVFMDYAVYPDGEGGQQHNWKQAYATLQEEGVWAFSGPAVNLLQGLQSNTAYKLEFSFHTNPGGKGSRAHYPVNGETISIKFTTGELPVMPSVITLDEPIIRMNGDRPEYIKFVGTDTQDNFKYTLETYDSEAHFQLTIEPADAQQGGAFPEGITSDENYWEPLFRQYTQQLAGEAMEASRNIKKLYVTNVALLPYQFAGYCDAMKEVYITTNGDYTIPAGCFSKSNSKNYGIKTLECKVEGNLTIGENAVDYEAGGLNIYTSNEGIAKIWFEYKNTHNCAYTVYLNGTIYNGGGGGGVVTNDPTITGVTISSIFNGNNGRSILPNEGRELMNEKGVTELKILGFNATVTGNVTELFMDYAVYTDGEGGQQHNWKQAYATFQEDGTWAFNGPTINLLQGLQSNTAYEVEFSFNTNPTDKGGRAHYPTSGEKYRMKFTTGELPVIPSVITLDEPIIRMNGDRPEYIKFVGTDTQDNFKYTLDTYDSEAHFQLTIEPADAQRSGAFPEGITSDENYWEPLFRQYTQQLAGEAMEASRNIKMLNVVNVALLPYQFAGYCDAMQFAGLYINGDYTIPAGCFSKGNSKNYSLKTLECKVEGNLTIGENAVDYEAGGLNIYTETEYIAQTWYDYKVQHNCAYTIYLQGTVYNGGGVVSDEPCITGVTVSYAYNGNNGRSILPNEGRELMNDRGVTELKILGFNATVTGNVTELFMDYAVFPEDQSGAQHEWKQAYASLQKDGVWAFYGPTVNLLKDLPNNTAYKVEFSFNTNPGGKNGRAHYPTSGETYSMKFITGELQETPEAITPEEPIVQMNGDTLEYVKFAGSDNEDNYKFALETYDGEANFRLVLEPVDISATGAIPSDASADDNYWETLFRNFTQQLLGEALNAQENVKQLYVTDVTLLPYQFAAYSGAMQLIDITATGDYTIPVGCFAKSNTGGSNAKGRFLKDGGDGYSLKTLECKVAGNLTIGENAVDYTASGLKINTYREEIAQTWIEYKMQHSCAYTVYLNGVQFEGTGISGVKVAPENSTIYDLQGHKVQNVQKGIYIINGKKVLMR